jgi:hypothetical protein
MGRVQTLVAIVTPPIEARASGGLVVVVIGVIAVMTITSTSLGTVPAEEKATIAASAFTVLGTIVGALFGVLVGARGKDEVERLAAHIDPKDAERVLDAVEGPAA